MTATLDDCVSAYLRSIRPRAGFEAELLTSLRHDRHRLYPLAAAAEDHPRARWIVAGALAGVESATGVAYVAVRRHRGAA